MDSKAKLSFSLVALVGVLAAAGCSDEAINDPAIEDGIVTEEVADDTDIQADGDPALAREGNQPREDTAARRDAPPRDIAAGRAADARDGADIGQAVAIVSPASGSEVRGTIIFTQQDDGVMIETNLSGLEPGAHGFHVHEFGDCSAQDASSAGDHFSPHDRRHGTPEGDPGERHVGDLGNLEANQNGVAQHSLTDYVISFEGENSILGKAIVVHSGEDDLTTQPDGDSGMPVACGVIQPRSELTQTPPGEDSENV